MEDPDGALGGVHVRHNADAMFSHLRSWRDRSRPDLIVFNGDLTHDDAPASNSYIETQLSALSFPLEVTPGNHDGDAMLQSSKRLPTTRLLDDGWHLHLLDSRSDDREQGHLTPSSLDYLRRAMSTSHQRHVIVFHHDVFQPGDAVRPGLDGASARALTALLAESDARSVVVVCGHRHEFAVATIGRLTFVNCGAVACQFAFQTSLPPITTSGNVEFVLLDLPSEANPAVTSRCVL